MMGRRGNVLRAGAEVVHTARASGGGAIARRALTMASRGRMMRSRIFMRTSRQSGMITMIMMMMKMMMITMIMMMKMIIMMMITISVVDITIIIMMKMITIITMRKIIIIIIIMMMMMIITMRKMMRYRDGCARGERRAAAGRQERRVCE